MANYEEAFSAARTEEDTGLEAFRRVCLELMERLEVLAWWMGMGLTAAAQEDEMATAEIAEVDEGDDERLTDLVTRGHEDGSIDFAARALLGGRPAVGDALFRTPPSTVRRDGDHACA